MRGHITQRSKGSWSLVIDLGRNPVTRKKRQQWVTVHGARKAAEKSLSELLHELDTGAYVKPVKQTFGQFLEQWLQDYAWPNLSAETAQAYDIMARKHLIPALGNIPIQ